MTDQAPGRYQRPLIKLTWADDTEFAGLVVRCRRISCHESFELERARSELAAQSDRSTRDAWEPVQRLLVGSLIQWEGEAAADPVIVEWNLDDHRGRPVPVTLDGIQGQDLALTIEISTQLIRAATGVPAPLPQPSTEDPAVEADIPMSTVDLNEEVSPSTSTEPE
jgi:hypothetical protein